jgi:hypothetical protein
VSGPPQSVIVRSIVLHALVWGLVLSVVLSGLLLAIMRANPEIMLNDFPPDIKAKWGPMTARTKRQRLVAAGILLVALLTIVAASLATLPAFTTRQLTFACAFMYFVTMFGTFNVFDWLVLDYGLVYWQPRFVVLPGTEGMAGYRNYRFHFQGFLLGIPVVLLGSALAAGVLSIIRATGF